MNPQDISSISSGGKTESRTFVTLRSIYDAAYWAEHFGCTDAELREAVQTVGPAVIKVLKYLSRAKLPGGTNAH